VLKSEAEMARAARFSPRPFDPSVDAATERRWQAWLGRVVGRERERLAGFGAVVVLGFLAGAGAVYAFAWLATEVLEQDTTRVDATAAAFVRQFSSPTVDRLAWLFSLFGSEVIWVLGLCLLALFVWQRRWGTAVLLVLVAGGAQLLNDILKTVFHRDRPEAVVTLISAQSYSFPSGHAMVAAAFYFFLAYLAWRLVRGWWRWVMVAGLLLLVVLIGLSRIYLQVHYLSDVIAGYVAGFVWTDAVILGSHALSTERQPTT
jgi:membrane-associated phospholipid phosphatase